MDAETVRQAAMAAELSRHQTRQGVKGWFLVIIPFSCFLLALLCYSLQKASGFPFFDTLGLSSCSKKGGCDTNYTQEQKNVARIFIGIMLLLTCYFLFDIWKGGAEKGVVGGPAAEYSLDAREAMRTEALNAQAQVSELMDGVQANRTNTGAQLPKGTTDRQWGPTAQVPTTQPYAPSAPAYSPPASYAPPSVPQNTAAADMARRMIGGDFVPQANPTSGSMFNEAIPIG